jgi:polyphosphate kinase
LIELLDLQLNDTAQAVELNGALQNNYLEGDSKTGSQQQIYERLKEAQTVEA